MKYCTNARRVAGAFWWFGICLLFAGVLNTGNAQVIDKLTYNEVQAAYIYKIASLVSWPDGTHFEHFTVCVVEPAEEVSRFIRDAVGKRTINGLPVVVIQLSADRLVSAADFSPCQLVYLLEPVHNQAIPDVAEQPHGTPVIWVSAPSVQANGTALFELALEGRRLVIYVNREQLRSSGLQVAAPLLSVARPR
ncbi:MAG: hypothetical protein CMK83_08510 [Pseudomonadales bacterium]|jgi:hypothetical protein|uniref:YfiR family protein n=1 Tax=unclassified Ketobacter TaxID=2639109 RepID=UPI000C8F860F|nr:MULTISPECIES: YfiR family protein [unclassified Ketobacter]MAA59883.1 hypothetical protein [Pseudomonadales bacterium]MEC8812057.1 YfiR family protein [Pseudomonadota bacterium]TNC91070.1 MAG: hypothetical protein CSH49_00250 [Alcanivorax sp.]HAG92511.1 hypothetical protein [Gammaproteobacteria bacterium]MAQ24252.1 hypothetical protein [Pseudomonadales bacterium]|tara:strand:+ start:8539 stop:9117 length:579 start_codon:yes stop_codon:yes gene_type:complete